MHGDDGRVVPRGDLLGAGREQEGGVTPRERELAAALQRDEGEDQRRQRHAALLSTAQLDVKPGPSALITDTSGRPSRRTRSSTKSTVGDDMLP